MRRASQRPLSNVDGEMLCCVGISLPQIERYRDLLVFFGSLCALQETRKYFLLLQGRQRNLACLGFLWPKIFSFGLRGMRPGVRLGNRGNRFVRSAQRGRVVVSTGL